MTRCACSIATWILKIGGANFCDFIIIAEHGPVLIVRISSEIEVYIHFDKIAVRV